MLKVSYSVETEASRLYLTTIKHILNGFFTKNNWYVIQMGINYKIMDPVVILPKLNYRPIIKKYWVNGFLEKQYENDEKIITKYLVSELIRTQTFTEISTKELNKLQKTYENILKKVLQKTYQVLDYIKPGYVDINIYPSYLSTCGSFSVCNPSDEKKVINLMPRLDVFKESIVELFASSITRAVLDKNPNISWRETESVSDFLTKYVYGYKNYRGTLDIVTEYNPQLMHQSLSYLMELGFPTGQFIEYNQDNHQLAVGGNDLSQILSPYEIRLVEALVKCKSKTLSYDAIAEELYNSHADVKFSLWGITKTVQRVRDKLEKYGIPRGVIRNIKGEGFELVA